MVFYFLFASNLALIFYRLIRSGKWGERTVLLVLSLFLILTLAVHPAFIQVSATLSFLEDTALALCLAWLASGALFSRLEKRRSQRTAFRLLKSRKGPFYELISACQMLSDDKQGGLIALRRRDLLDKWIQSGIPLGAQVRRETLFSLFTPPGALHDGGVIIQQDRIAAGGVIFPLTKRNDLPTELGTRHRAALGMSEATDAVVLVVSEETGKISLADRGSLFYDIRLEKLPGILESAFSNKLRRKTPSRLAVRPASELVEK